MKQLTNKFAVFRNSTWQDIANNTTAFRDITKAYLNSQSMPTIADDEQSWRTDVPGSGLKSTQQLNVDWSDFTNHCFFNSAEAKVNLAFEKIINTFPFDGTEQDTWNFLDTISGFDTYILSLWPKSVGYITLNQQIKII